MARMIAHNSRCPENKEDMPRAAAKIPPLGQEVLLLLSQITVQGAIILTLDIFMNQLMKVNSNIDEISPHLFRFTPWIA